MDTYFALQIIVTVLQVVDFVTTVKALSRPGAREANPIMRASMKAFGIRGGLVAMKIPLLGVVWFLDTPVAALWIMTLLYAWVAVNNVKVIRSQGDSKRV